MWHWHHVKGQQDIEVVALRPSRYWRRRISFTYYKILCAYRTSRHVTKCGFNSWAFLRDFKRAVSSIRAHNLSCENEIRDEIRLHKCSSFFTYTKYHSLRRYKIIIMPLFQKMCVKHFTLRKDYKYGCLQIECLVWYLHPRRTKKILTKGLV